MAGIRGIDYYKYHVKRNTVKRKRKLRPWVIVVIRIIILPLTLPIRLYKWVYYD
jgi:hypothetical protein